MIWCCAALFQGQDVHEEDDVDDRIYGSPSPSLRQRSWATPPCSTPGAAVSDLGPPFDSIPEAYEPMGEDAEREDDSDPYEQEDGEGGEEDGPFDVYVERGEDVEDDGPFDVYVELALGQRFGAVLDVLDNSTLRIMEVLENGRLRLHNTIASERKRVLPGYYIVSVNGKCGRSEEMVKELRRTRSCHLRVARKEEFTVSLQKSGPLCLDLQFGPDKDCLVIRRIGEGLVRKHNISVGESSQQIRVGDRILGVNDSQEVPARTLLESIRTSGSELNMKFARPLGYMVAARAWGDQDEPPPGGREAARQAV